MQGFIQESFAPFCFNKQQVFTKEFYNAPAMEFVLSTGTHVTQ